MKYRQPNGKKGRYRHDAEVQTIAAARAEERRRLAALATTGSPYDTPAQSEKAPASEERPKATETNPKGLPFAEIADLYLTSFAPSQLKPSTLHGYKKTIQNFLISRIGTRPVDEIDAGVLRDLDAELVRHDVKPATRRQMAIALRSILCRYAVEAKILPRAPDFPSLPKIGGKIMNAITREDVDQLLAVCCKAHRLAFLLAAFAGLRAGEIRGLRRYDVDLSAGQLVVRENVCRGAVAAPKSGHERIVPLVPELRAAIEALEPASRTAPVALTAKGTRWGEYGLRQAFLRACRRAGLKGLAPP